MSKSRWVVGIAAMLLFAGLLSYAAASRDAAVKVYGYVSYYLILALLLVWLLVALDAARAFAWSLTTFWARNRLHLALALALSLGVFLSVPPRFRVLSDETNLLGVSLSMASSRTAFNPTMAKRYYGNLNIINNEIEKRPLLFPFLVHLAHQCRGYRYTNPFWVNFFVLFLILSGIMILASRRAGPWVCLAAAVLVASYPLVSLCAASGGQELLSTLMFGATAAALYGFLRVPSAEAMALFWATMLLWCHTRYECFVGAAVLVGGAAMLGCFRRDYMTRRPELYLATPLLMLPLIVQRMLIPSPYENAPALPAFSWLHFKFHALALIRAQFAWNDPLSPHAAALNCVSALMLASLAYAWARRWIDHGPAHRRHLIAILAACVAVQTALFLSYYGGNYVHPASARFFLTVSILGALVPVVFHVVVPRLLSERGLLILALAGAALYHPIAVGARHTNSLELVREFEACKRFVLETVKDDTVLYIYSRPGQITVLDRGAVDFAWANLHSHEVLNELDRKLYSSVYVIQRVDYFTGKPVPEDSLGPEFSLQTMQEIQNTSVLYLRFSRVRPARAF